MLVARFRNGFRSFSRHDISPDARCTVATELRLIKRVHTERFRFDISHRHLLPQGLALLRCNKPVARAAVPRSKAAALSRKPEWKQPIRSYSFLLFSFFSFPFPPFAGKFFFFFFLFHSNFASFALPTRLSRGRGFGACAEPPFTWPKSKISRSRYLSRLRTVSVLLCSAR